MGLGRSLILTHPNRIGDTVLSLPLHRAVSRAAELHSNVGPAYRFFLELGGAASVYAGPLYPKKLSELLHEARELRRREFQNVFLVRPNFRSALLAKLARIPVRIGDPSEGRGPLLTHVVRSVKSNQLDRLEAFGKRVGLDVPREFGLKVDSVREEKRIGIVPAASYSDKIIPASALHEVCRRLLAAGYEIVLLGGPGEESWAEPLSDIPAESWIGKFKLQELIEPLGRLRALVAADGGLYHLAVACGVPSVGAYGPTTKNLWWHEWGPHHAVLAPDDKMSSVTADMLWAALQKTLDESSADRKAVSSVA